MPPVKLVKWTELKTDFKFPRLNSHNITGREGILAKIT
jgi:hypothetical protein